MSKQGAKQEPCSSLAPAAVLDTETKTGTIFRLFIAYALEKLYDCVGFKSFVTKAWAGRLWEV